MTAWADDWAALQGQSLRFRRVGALRHTLNWRGRIWEVSCAPLRPPLLRLPSGEPLPFKKTSLGGRLVASADDTLRVERRPNSASGEVLWRGEDRLGASLLLLYALARPWCAEPVVPPAPQDRAVLRIPRIRRGPRR